MAFFAGLIVLEDFDPNDSGQEAVSESFRKQFRATVSGATGSETLSAAIDGNHHSKG